MKKFFVTAIFLTFCFVSISAQSDDFSDEELPGSIDDSLIENDDNDNTIKIIKIRLNDQNE